MFDKKPSFLILVPFRKKLEPEGGSSIRIASYTKGLLEKGFDFKFLSYSKPSYVPVDHYIYFGLKPRWARILLLHNLLYNSRLGRPFAFLLHILLHSQEDLKRIEKLAKDKIVWSHQDNNIALYLFLKNSQKFIYDVHGIIHIQTEYKEKLNIIERLWFWQLLMHEKLTFKKANYINAVSIQMKKYIVKTFSPKGEIFIAPDGIPATISEYKNALPNKSFIRDYQIPKDARIILFAGSFKKIGGVQFLTEVFCKNSKEFTNSVLVLIGDGHMKHELLNTINQYKCKSNVILLPIMNHSDLLGYMKIADVIVCPDISNEYNEMVPHIKLFDAVASGKKVIASGFEVNKNEFPDSVFNIHYYKPDDAFELLHLLIAENINPKLVPQYYLEDRSYERRVKKYFQLYFKNHFN